MEEIWHQLPSNFLWVCVTSISVSILYFLGGMVRPWWQDGVGRVLAVWWQKGGEGEREKARGKVTELARRALLRLGDANSPAVASPAYLPASLFFIISVDKTGAHGPVQATWTHTSDMTRAADNCARTTRGWPSLLYDIWYDQCVIWWHLTLHHDFCQFNKFQRISVFF